MASIRERANGNSLIWRVRDDAGQWRQRSIYLGPTRSPDDAAKFFRSEIERLKGEHEALRGVLYSGWNRTKLEREIDRNREYLAEVLAYAEANDAHG